MAGEETSPVLTVFAGPNGSGKSTLAERMQRQGIAIGPFINPDVIAKSLSGSEQTRNLEAGRETLRQVREKIDGRESFSRESTLSGREIMGSMRSAQRANFRVHLIFVAVEHMEASIARVRDRVAKGGHDIPEAVQRCRFDKSLSNAATAAGFVDQVLIYDNSLGVGHRLMAQVEHQRLVHLTQPHPVWIETIVSGLRRGGDA